MTPFRENLRGILGITACNLLFLINDAMIKLAGSTLPLGQILFIRGLFASLLLVPLVLWTGAHRHFRLVWSGAMFWRMLAEVCGTLLFLTALFHLPIANINAILQVIPLMVTASAALFLGEYVGWRRWVAIGVGFAGVMIVIRPGLEGFTAYSLIALGAMVFVTLRDMTTRFMPRHLPALLVALVTAVCVGLSGPAVGIVAGESWAMPEGRDLALVIGSAIFLIGGYMTAVDFMRHGDIAVIAPFRYSVVIWAILVGYLVWSEVPDLPMLLGTVVIVATGVYTFHRERRLARLVAESDIDH